MSRPAAANTNILSAATQLMSSDRLLPRKPPHHNTAANQSRALRSVIGVNSVLNVLNVLTDSDDAQSVHLEGINNQQSVIRNDHRLKLLTLTWGRSDYWISLLTAL